MHGARPSRKSAVGLLAWRSLNGLGRLSNRFRPSGASSLVWVMHGVRPGARARLPPCPRRERDPDPALPTKTLSPPDGQERSENLPSPFKDLHASRITGSFPQRSYGEFSILLQKQAPECRLSAKKREGVPEKRYFAPHGTSYDPLETPCRSVKCVAFDADLAAAPAPCRSGGGSEGDEVPPLIPTTMMRRVSCAEADA